MIPTSVTLANSKGDGYSYTELKQNRHSPRLVPVVQIQLELVRCAIGFYDTALMNKLNGAKSGLISAILESLG
jgi:hypothetical protein